MMDQYSKNFLDQQLLFLENKQWLINSKFNLVRNVEFGYLDFDLVFHADEGDVIYRKAIVHKIISVGVDYIHERAGIVLSETCFLCGRMDIEHGSDRKHRD